jgi:hypothetical protein
VKPQLLAHDPPTSELHDAISVALDAIAARLDATCLLESRDGDIVGHAAQPSAPQAAVTAIVQRRTAALNHAALRRRTVAVVPGGAVQSLQLAGQRLPALTAPVVISGCLVGWLWVLPEHRRAVVNEVCDAAATVALAATGLLRPPDAELVRCLTGAEGAHLPGRHLDAAGVWVAAVTVAGNFAPPSLAGMLRSAIRTAGAPQSMATVRSVRMSIGQLDATGYIVLSAPKERPERVVAGIVEELLSTCERPLRAGLSRRWPASHDLSGPRTQADAAVAVNSRDGRCLTLERARPEIVLRRVCESIAALPDMGPDPLHELLAYDRRRGTELGPSLLAWLEAGQDVALASATSGVHHNTLRYRLRRARELLEHNLDHPSTRLELHLRLRTALLGPAAADRGLAANARITR